MAAVIVPQGVGRTVRQARLVSSTGHIVQPDLGPGCARPEVSTAEGLRLGSVDVLVSKVDVEVELHVLGCRLT